MSRCESCKYCKKYKIHKRVLNFIPVKLGDTTYHNKAYIEATQSFSEFEDITICDFYKCEIDGERENCEYRKDYVASGCANSVEDLISREDAQTEIMMFAGNVKSDEDDIFIKVSDAVQLLRELPSAEKTSPCDLCRYNPPSSFDEKPCSICPACEKR